MTLSKERPSLSFAERIEHTLLNTKASDDDVAHLCKEALEEGFRAVCCLPRDVVMCRKLLQDSKILVVTVVDFPLGSCTLDVARFECERVIENGADEVDMVVDIRALRLGDLGSVRDGIAGVVAAAQGRPVKTILETGLLTQQQIVGGCVAAEAGGAAYVKTSTGFGPRGAGTQDVALMRAAVGNRIGIKAAGGIRTHAFARELVEAGADLIGTSSGSDCLPAACVTD
ncbi:MAG: deoxyribose-phosphate aldolase [Deltaproteobacteria bacterium]|nr:deoxyribose-phosphate aldolase [Deltaproteobacteria bacterium]